MFKRVLLAAAASVGASGLIGAMIAKEEAQKHKIFGFEPIRRAIQQHKRDHTKNARGSIAQRNRWTGKPHEHLREKARRLRQMARA